MKLWLRSEFYQKFYYTESSNSVGHPLLGIHTFSGIWSWRSLSRSSEGLLLYFKQQLPLLGSWVKVTPSSPKSPLEIFRLDTIKVVEVIRGRFQGYSCDSRSKPRSPPASRDSYNLYSSHFPQKMYTFRGEGVRYLQNVLSLFVFFTRHSTVFLSTTYSMEKTTRN